MDTDLRSVSLKEKGGNISGTFVASTNLDNSGHAGKDNESTGGSNVIEYDKIMSALNELKCLETKQNVLTKGIDVLIKDLRLLKGAKRTKVPIRELTYLNKEMEDVEVQIKTVLDIIEPWKELYANKKRFEEMKQGGGDVAAERLFKISELLKENANENVSPPKQKKSSDDNDLPLIVFDDPIEQVVTDPMPEMNVDMQPNNMPNVQSENVERNADGGENNANVFVKPKEVGNVWGQKKLFGNVQTGGEEEEDDYGKLKNAVKIKWTGEREDFPSRRFVAKILVKQLLGFSEEDVYAMISVTDMEFDLSFKLSQGLEEFWRKYNLTRNAKEWGQFRVIPISKPEYKNVTILMKNETVHQEDVLIWLKRQCTVVSPLVKIYDEEGFWVGGYKVQVKFNSEGYIQRHLPTSFFIGKDRGVCFYVGQPKLCFKCGARTHLASKCSVKKCAFCGETGHLSKECEQ
ncbi:uncharacterized protein LOC121395426 [Xenopus laevis]|uniref:Uncharacterized protein LOC121395426 n=1 Tax=Xenopus laevis TaxID=8355 RepID=A0A8J1L7H3_XENLA|nr:uncharacterized protein LOC121395426 [Xenopus laevis]